MFAWNKKALTICSVVVLSAALLACGGGSSSDSAADDTPAEVPSFAGTYDASFTKTSDTCSSGAIKNAKITQTVTQSGRDITLVSNTATLHGSVDADNAGFSVSFQSTSNGVAVTSSAVYRTTSTPELFGAGLSVVAKSGGVVCTVSYNGQAKRK